MPDTTNKFSIKELTIGMLIICLIGFAFIWLTFYFFVDESKELVYETPNVESPITTSTVSGLNGRGGPSYKETDIITSANAKDYGTLTKEIWDEPNKFLEQMESVALNGKFLEAELIVNGEIDDKLKHLISVTIDYRSGKYNVSKNGCEEKEKCLFSKDNPIDLNIDLMNSTLLSGNKYRLWNDIQPQPNVGKTSIAKILIMPMDLQGNPSSKITSLRIRYLCEEDGCEIKKCNDYPSLSVEDAEYQCALDAFGAQDARNL